MANLARAMGKHGDHILGVGHGRQARHAQGIRCTGGQGRRSPAGATSGGIGQRDRPGVCAPVGDSGSSGRRAARTVRHDDNEQSDSCWAHEETLARLSSKTMRTAKSARTAPQATWDGPFRDAKLSSCHVGRAPEGTHTPPGHVQRGFP
jgi:hypothetical protein